MDKNLCKITVAAVCIATMSTAEASQIPFESYGGLSYSQDASHVAKQMQKDGFALSQTLKNQADVYKAQKNGIGVTVVCIYAPNGGGLQDIVVSFEAGTGAADNVFAGEAATVSREMGVAGTTIADPGTDANGNQTGITQKMVWPQPYGSASRVIVDETSSGTIQAEFQGDGYASLSHVSAVNGR